ncbi:MAG: universal stress protein [Pirellulaceae bacterium]|nr:universal stress protein [Pirellulaceae bacterium]
MNRFQTIVVALSATEADRTLLSYARLLASIGLGRHYHFVHVRTPARKADESESDAQVLRRCEEMVHEVFGTLQTDVSLDCHLVEGVRVDKLLEFVSSRHCDVVLVGHRKSRSGQRSLAKRLAMIAPCSVWLVPEGAAASITNVLVPVDFSDNSADSVVVATSIAQAAGLPECIAVHVFSDPTMIRYDERLEDLRHHEQASFRHFIGPIDRHGVNVEAMYVEGNNVAGTILYTAGRCGTDLLVMNTRGRSRAASILLGSVTTQVLVDAPTAVLAVKHSGAMLNLFQALHEGSSRGEPNPKTN